MQHLNLDLLVNRNHLTRVTNTAPAHIRNVQQSIDATEIDEGSEVGNVLDDTAADLADLQRLHQLLLSLGPLLLNERPAGNHDVSPRFIDLQNEALDRTVAVVADISRSSNIDLTRRQENVDARNVNQ